MTNEIEKIKRQVAPILKKYKAKRAGIFGSYARQEQRKKSDIDILIEISNKYSYLHLAELKIELEKKLKKSVDLVEYDLIHPFIKNKIMNEEVNIYG